MANKKFRDHSLSKYLDGLAAREPIPGGGSAAAVSSAMGAALIVMVARYSVGKSGSKAIDSRMNKTIKKAEKIRQRLQVLIDLDAQAYLNLVRSKNASASVRSKAQKAAISVPKEICQLSYDAVQLAPYLIEKGSKYLVSDVEAAVEFLLAGFNSALAMIKSNQ